MTPITRILLRPTKRELERLPGSQHLEIQLAFGVALRARLPEHLDARDRLAIDLDDDVAIVEAGAVRGRGRQHGEHENARAHAQGPTESAADRGELSAPERTRGQSWPSEEDASPHRA